MARSAQPDRRALWVAAAVLAGTIVVGVLVVAVITPTDIIPRPDEGRPPRSPGQRGGWEQLATLAAVVAGLAAVGTLVWRSSRRAKEHASMPQVANPPDPKGDRDAQKDRRPQPG